MTCRTIEPCGQPPCEALQEIRYLLPKGRIWELSEGRDFTRFWSAIAEAKSALMAGICCEWMEANPCTAKRTLERWAEIWCFPVDCVDLTSEKLCEWIEFINTCNPRTEGFILGLLDFAGVDRTDLNIEFFDPCGDAQGCCDADITISGPHERFTEVLCDCTWGLLETLRHPCGKLVIPEIECLRRDYFPAGMKVKYRSDCDPNLIRHIRAS